MFAPAATGPGAAIFEIDRIGVEFTVTVTGAPAVGAVSFESTWKLLLVITVPFASGEFTLTVSVTEPDEPAFTFPIFQVTTPPATEPDAEADTNAVLAGSGSWMTTPVALFVPTFWYASV